MTSSAENIRHLGTFIFKYRPLGKEPFHFLGTS